MFDKLNERATDQDGWGIYKIIMGKYGIFHLGPGLFDTVRENHLLLSSYYQWQGSEQKHYLSQPLWALSSQWWKIWLSTSVNSCTATPFCDIGNWDCALSWQFLRAACLLPCQKQDLSLGTFVRSILMPFLWRLFRSSAVFSACSLLQTSAGKQELVCHTGCCGRGDWCTVATDNMGTSAFLYLEWS